MDNVMKNPLKIIGFILAQLLIFALLYLMKEYNYNLFHSFVECYSIGIALGVFFIVINSKDYLDNNFLNALSIGYFFTVIIDFTHMLAFKGMNIFTGYDANLPTQLWTFSRYVESISLLVATIFIKRPLNRKLLYGAYFLITASGLYSIFGRYFPDAFIEGTGLTPFKIYSEYIIIGLMLIALYFLYRKRNYFDKTVLKYFYLSFIFAILTDFMFTLYADPFDLFNLLGHYFKIISVYFIYKSVIKVAIKNPQNIIFTLPN